jgi:hypothetical protein
MNRILVVGACAAGFVLTSSVGPAVAAEPHRGCPAGFDIGLLSIEQSADLVVANGFPGTREDVVAGVSRYDKNADQLLCVQDFPDTRGTPSYVFNFVDNRAR